MCLACYVNFKTPENLEVAKTHAKPAPWHTEVISGKEFAEWCEPEPERIEIFGAYFEIHRVYLHDPINNKSIMLSDEQIEEIGENALAIVATGTDDWIDIWALQWPNNYKIKNKL